jgi:hypothetical protein
MLSLKYISIRYIVRQKEAERLYLNSIYTVNSRIVDTRYKLTDKDRIIEKYTEESEV